MIYRLETLLVILKAEGYPCAPTCLLVHGKTITSYYYPPMPFTLEQLLEDSAQYFSACSTSNTQTIRRICFLLPSIAEEEQPLSALIVELPLPSSERRDIFLRTYSMSYNQTSSILLLQNLYSHVRVWMIGSIVQNNVLSAPLIQLLQTAYPNLHLQLQPIIAAPYANVVLTECILMILKTGEIKVVDVSHALQRHRQCCAQAVLLRLQSFQIHFGTGAIEPFLQQCRVLFKYAALRRSREKYILAQASYEQLQIINTQDRAQKAMIYHHSLLNIDMHLLISRLTLTPLVHFLQTDSLDAWLLYLNHECEAQLKDLKQWEDTFAHYCASQLNWKRQTYNGIQQALQYVYQYSLVGLGAELVPWMSQSIVRPLSTLIPEHILTYSIKSKNWLNICRCFGGGLGALGTYSLGGYWLGKSLFTGYLAQKLKYYCLQLLFNDEDATLILPIGSALTTLKFIRIAALMVAIAESAYTKDPAYMAQTLGGLLGSVSIVHLAKQLIPGLSENQAQPLNEEQAMALLFIGMGGYEFGSGIAGYIIQGIDKLLARERLTQAFCEITAEKELTGCVTDFSEQFLWSPSFWINSQDYVRLGYTSHHLFQERSCEILKHTSGERTVTCDLPILTHRLPLY